MAAVKGKKAFDPNMAEKTLAKAKAKGRLTVEEMNKILPEDAGAEEIDRLMLSLGGTELELVEEPGEERGKGSGKAEGAQTAAAARLEARKEAQRVLERADDPVRMYLREMGRVPLLTKD